MGEREQSLVEASAENRCRILNRDAIKYIAMLTMLFNHVAGFLFMPGSVMYGAFTSIGYFTAIAMIYFLVEGYYYTHSRKVYFERLFVFAVISQIPFQMVFAPGEITDFWVFNMLFTLCLCFGLIWVMENVREKTAKTALVLLLVLTSTMCDWPVLAPVFTLLFLWAGHSQKKLKMAFAGAVFIFTAYNLWEGSHWLPMGRNLLYAAFGAAGMGMAALCILYLYNGKRMEKGRKFSKWFFYVFYPAHLLVLGIIRIVTSG